MVENAAYLTAGGVDSVLATYKDELDSQRYVSAVNESGFLDESSSATPRNLFYYYEN